jgi:hypothetical protein
VCTVIPCENLGRWYSTRGRGQDRCDHIFLHRSDPLQGCGLVAESHVIDESSEWRNFGDKVCPRTLWHLAIYVCN